MGKLLVMLVCVLLIGCSSTKIHLYSRYLSNYEIKTVSENIENLGFDVEINTLPFPVEINESTLIYPVIFNYDEDLDGLTSSLSLLGWPISNKELLVNGNHWFQNSAGLFILPEGVQQDDKIPPQDLANEYESKNCEKPLKIKLNSDNTYQFFFTEMPNNRSDYLKGQWKLTSYPYIELISFNERWLFYFEIERKIEVDKVSEIDIMELIPQDKYEIFPNCSFVYGQRI
jgi:hypothetical protein